jgi:hypothetical protein
LGRTLVEVSPIEAAPEWRLSEAPIGMVHRFLAVLERGGDAQLRIVVIFGRIAPVA